eukprot:6542922-Prymnesium_polylepis.2
MLLHAREMLLHAGHNGERLLAYVRLSTVGSFVADACSAPSVLPRARASNCETGGSEGHVRLSTHVVTHSASCAARLHLQAAWCVLLSTPQSGARRYGAVVSSDSGLILAADPGRKIGHGDLHL